MAPTPLPPHDPAVDPDTGLWTGVERRQGGDVVKALDEVRRLNNSVVTLATSVQQSAEREALAQRRFQLLMAVAVVAVAFIALWVRLSDIWAANRIATVIEEDLTKRVEKGHDFIACLIRPDSTTTDRLTACRLETESDADR